MLKLYNTLTGKIEEFRPLNPPNVGYYSCGPTVYDFAHIGHARTYIFADILQRVLEFNGYRVKRVMNITDVGHLTSDRDTGEDKMEKGAAREQKTVWQIAEFYTQDFFDMLGKLNIKKPQIICRATDHIKEMIELIETLKKKGFTYIISDGVYFDTAKFTTYGKLTGQTFSRLQANLKAGIRVEVVTGKKHPTDFALWKFSYPQGRPFDPVQDDVARQRQMEWDSPWGKGFPGWHIECSAMSMKFLGKTIDIHTGGIDHIPIHHSNEIAQSQAATGKTFVKYWLHAAHLLIEGQKMSKSLDNFYRILDLENKGFHPLALRYLFLTANYRLQMNFTWKSLGGAQNAFNALRGQISGIRNQMSGKERISLSEEKQQKVNWYRNEFTAAVNNDLGTAAGLAVVWQVVKSNIGPADKYDLLLLFDEVLGLGINQITEDKQQITIPEDIRELIAEREELRKERKWEEADRMRKKIEEKGYLVQDAPSGPKVKVI